MTEDMPTHTSAKPTVRMTEAEAWEFVSAAINGTLTTLRRDGRPVALPVWFAVVDRRIYISTRGKKLVRVTHDARASFLVEDGERWVELRAVHIDCEARLIEPDDELSARIGAVMDVKYNDYRAAGDTMPAAARKTYQTVGFGTIELIPNGKLLNWDNRKLTPREPKDSRESRESSEPR